VFLNILSATEVATLCSVELILRLSNRITDTILVTKGLKYVPRGLHVGHPCYSLWGIVLYKVHPTNGQRYARYESLSLVCGCVSSSCGLIIYHGNVGCFRNVGRSLLYNTASQPRRQYVFKDRKNFTAFPLIIFYIFSICSVIANLILYITRATMLYLQSSIPTKLLHKHLFLCYQLIFRHVSAWRIAQLQGAVYISTYLL
jgi:hypothetical protein